MGTGIQRRDPWQVDRGQVEPRQVAVTDDHRLVTVVLAGDQSSRAEVRAGLERHRFTVVAEADDVDHAVEAALLHQPQVCLLDVDTPGGGIAAANRINADLPGTKIAMLFGSSGREELRDAVLAGADAYLPTSTAPDRLAEALNALVNGEAAVPRALTGDLLRELRSTAQPDSTTALVALIPRRAGRVPTSRSCHTISLNRGRACCTSRGCCATFAGASGPECPSQVRGPRRECG